MFGFLVAPDTLDFVQTYLSTLRDLDFAHLNTIFAEMEARGWLYCDGQACRKTLRH